MNYDSLMREKLPGFIYQLLRSIGETGDEIGCYVFVVGGFVRDLLMLQPNLDADIVVDGDGIAFAQAFACCKSGQVKSHERFGTAVVTLADGFKIDAATARTEVYIHSGALPVVKPGSIKEDLHRRDFTINSMAIKLNSEEFGQLVDFFGGMMDLQNRSIRILHDYSFVDDPTRMFRAIKYEQRYGFSIEPHTEELLEKAVMDDSLKMISRQRFRNEILLILKESDPVPALRRMAHFHLMKYIHPEIHLSHYLAVLFYRIREVFTWWNSISSTGHRKADIILLNLMALLDQLDAAQTEDVSVRLVLTRRYAEALKVFKNQLPDILQLIAEDIPHSRIWELLKELLLEELLFAMASSTGRARDNISLYLTRIRGVKPWVDGNDLHRLGYPEGPLYTRILDKTFAAQLDGVLADKQQAIDFIKSKFPI